MMAADVGGGAALECLKEAFQEVHDYRQRFAPTSPQVVLNDPQIAQALSKEPVCHKEAFRKGLLGFIPFGGLELNTEP